jgi:hypothetical protein
VPGEGEKRQAAVEFGIRLAKALMLHARSEAPKEGLSSQAVINAASDYLAKVTEHARESPLDPSLTDPQDRQN